MERELPSIDTQQIQNICITLYNVGPTSSTLSNIVQMLHKRFVFAG